MSLPKSTYNLNRLAKKMQARLASCIFLERKHCADIYYDATEGRYFGVWETCQGDLCVVSSRKRPVLDHSIKEGRKADAEVGPVGDSSHVKPG